MNLQLIREQLLSMREQTRLFQMSGNVNLNIDLYCSNMLAKLNQLIVKIEKEIEK